MIQKLFVREAQCGSSPHLMRKHIPSDLVGNDVRVICEDVVQDGAVILSWNENNRMKVRHKRSSRVTVDRLTPHLTHKSRGISCKVPAAELSSRPRLPPPLCFNLPFTPPPPPSSCSSTALTLCCSNTSVALTFLSKTTC